jgi:hypothetical protein
VCDNFALGASVVAVDESTHIYVSRTRCAGKEVMSICTRSSDVLSFVRRALDRVHALVAARVEGHQRRMALLQVTSFFITKRNFDEHNNNNNNNNNSQTSIAGCFLTIGADHVTTPRFAFSFLCNDFFLIFFNAQIVTICSIEQQRCVSLTHTTLSPFC